MGDKIHAVFFLLTFIVFSLAVGCIGYDENVVNPSYYEDGYEYYECGADGEYIELINNPNATTTTHRNLMTFLKSDKTDEIIYNENTFVCADFAEKLHNNAEEAEIKAGWVGIEFEPWAPTYMAEPELRYRYGYNTVGHACNVFEMGDGELVFVDCTNGGEPGSFDTFVNVAIGSQYIPKDIDKNSDIYYESMGEVKDYTIYW